MKIHIFNFYIHNMNIRHAVSYLCHDKLSTWIRLHARILRLESVRIINCRKTRTLEGQFKGHGNPFPQCLLPPLGMGFSSYQCPVEMGSYALLYRDSQLRPIYEVHVYRDAKHMSADDDSLHSRKSAKSAHFKFEEDKISYKENIIVNLQSPVVKL